MTSFEPFKKNGAPGEALFWHIVTLRRHMDEYDHVWHALFVTSSVLKQQRMGIFEGNVPKSSCITI